MIRSPFTEADLHRAGSPFRLRDIQAFTGMSRPAIMAEVCRGALTGFQVVPRPGSPWLFDRHDVRVWWLTKRHKLAS